MIHESGRRFNTTRRFFQENKINLSVTGAGLAIIGLIYGITGLAEAGSRTDKPRRDAVATATAVSIQSQRQIVLEQLELTGGVNLDYMPGNQVLIRLNDSAKAAVSREDVLNRALARITRETNCERLGPLTYLPGNPDRTPPEHEAYSVTTICS